MLEVDENGQHLEFETLAHQKDPDGCELTDLEGYQDRIKLPIPDPFIYESTEITLVVNIDDADHY